MRLLIVEDERRIAELLREALREAGFVTDAVNTAGAAHAALAATAYDAAILDLGLPDGDGLDVLRRLRAGGSGVPVLILTARDAVEDRVRGLDDGGDDYLVKPFSIEELISRVKALLRRPGGALGSVLQAGNVTLDTIGRDAQVDGRPASLSRREIDLLEQLMRRLGRVVPKEVLEERLYGIEEELESNAVPVHVHHLRRKLDQSGGSVEIHTVRGIGYLLAEIKR
jgi:DNA-binding response OmpR family regulator